MSGWSLLLCEGAHDQEFLCCLAQFAEGWHYTKTPPGRVLQNVRPGATLFYLVRRQKTLAIANLNGVDNIFGVSGKYVVEQARTAESVGILLDADDEGVAARRDRVRAHFGEIIAAARRAEHGEIMLAPDAAKDRRRFGLWIAPDGAGEGSFDDVIRKAADSRYPELTPIANDFVRDLGAAQNHNWGRFFQKAVLGSLGQLWKAGGSLASALQDRDRWMDRRLVAQEPFRGIVAFMEQLVS